MPLALPFVHRPDDLILGRSGPWRCFPSVRLRAVQRATHVYVVGTTGQGKSKLLQQLLYQDVMAGRGCGLLDPHSDLATDLLAQLYRAGYFTPSRRRERLLYLDPADCQSLIPFNVLAPSGEPYDTAANVIEAFRRTWPQSLAEAPRFTDILLHALLVLIANRLTLVELQRLLTDKAFREALLANADEAQREFFHYRLDRYGREQPLIIESVLNKASALTSNPRLRRILGQPSNQLDFRRIMDEGQVLVVNLGHCDGETRRLLGSLIVTGIEQAALARKSEPQRARPPFYFYLDEFASFVANEGSSTTFAHMLSEARKFGLSLTLAHQTLGQVWSESVRAALGNVGTKVVFAVEREDAEVLAKKLFQVTGEDVKHEVPDEAQQERTHPVFYSLAEAWESSVQAIQNLKPRHCWVKRPGQAVAKLHTLAVREAQLSERERAELKAMLRKPSLLPIQQGGAETTKGSERFVEYEPLPARKRHCITAGAVL